MTQRAIAAELGVEQPVIQRALALDRRLRAAGVDDPYELVTAPPAGGGKVRRHRHPRYRFQPLAGYPAWPTSAAA